MNNDLISRNALKAVITANHYLLSAKNNSTDYGMFTTGIIQAIDNAPAVDTYTIEDIKEVQENSLILGAKLAQRPQGEYVDISKLRLMTVEECAGHTIDYAMGWKACIEWIKKGGADNE